MQVRRRDHEEVSFQLAPMIDMTFLLLVFFMVTTKISREQPKIPIALPVASAAAGQPRDLSQRDTITIDADGTLYVRDRPLSQAELADYLKQRFVAQPPLKLYIRADRTTPAERTKAVMKLAAEAGAVDVIFGTYQRD